MLLKYLQRTDTITLDTDWFYRRGGQIVVNMVGTPLVHLSNSLSKTCFETIPGFLIRFGENPTAAIKIGVDTMAVWADKKMGRTPPLKKLVREKKIYPRSQIKPLSIGAGVAFILFFFIMMFLIILNII